VAALDTLFDRPTPLLRWGPALLVLELLRPTGGFDDRALPLLGAGDGVLEASGGAALAAATLRRKIVIRPRGVFTHEVRETLKIWGVALDAQARPTLPALDSDAAARCFEPLVAGLPPGTLIAPAGARAVLLAAVQSGRAAVALVAADEELPELPRSIDLPSSVERVAISRAVATAARARLCRELGMLAGHAAAAAAVLAHERGCIALVTSAGEREFSLDPRSPASASASS
jgi:hypothetical protein